MSLLLSNALVDENLELHGCFHLLVKSYIWCRKQTRSKATQKQKRQRVD